MKVSVIIPAFNEERHIARCLQYLKGQIESADEIIVVDNNSTDTTAAIANAFNVKVIEEKKQGMIPARNRGFNEARYDIIARTDADTHVPPDWIQQIKKRFVDDLELLGLSGPAHFYDGPQVIKRKIWPSKVAVQSTVHSVLKHDAMFGPNMALTKKAWDLIKNEVCQDDNKVHEDTDLAIHLAEHGRIFFDETLVVESSFRRFKKLKPYFEYPYRYLKTIEEHKSWIKMIKTKTLAMPKTMRTRTVKTMKHIAKVAKENGIYG